MLMSMICAPLSTLKRAAFADRSQRSARRSDRLRLRGRRGGGFFRSPTTASCSPPFPTPPCPRPSACTVDETDGQSLPPLVPPPACSLIYVCRCACACDEIRFCRFCGKDAILIRCALRAKRNIDYFLRNLFCVVTGITNHFARQSDAVKVAMPKPYAAPALSEISSRATCANRARALRQDDIFTRLMVSAPLASRQPSAARAKDHAPRDKISQRRDRAEQHHARASRCLQRQKVV